MILATATHSSLFLPLSRVLSAELSSSRHSRSISSLRALLSRSISDKIRHSSRRQEIRNVILDVTGKVYKLGPYKRPGQEQEKADPMQQFRQTLQDSGIAVEES